MIFHLDLDAFFASVEAKYYPQYKNLPLVVKGQKRSIIVGTCNYLARSYGIKKGAPIADALAKCSDLVVINNHRDRYEYWSKRFFDYLFKKFTDQIEIASIDECYIKVDSLLNQYHNNPVLLATIMQRSILNDLGLGVSIGIANTKEIAKQSTNFKKPLGISYTKDEEIEQKIHCLPIEKIIGLGKKSVAPLKEHNINNVKDFLDEKNKDLLYSILGINYYKIKNGLLGLGHTDIDLERNISKTIEKSFRFSSTEWDEEIIKSKIKQIGDLVIKEMKNQHQKAKVISVYLKYKDQIVHKKTKSIELTDNPIKLVREWIKVFYKLWENDKPIVLIGVGVTKLI